MSVFCRHNRFTVECPICSKGTVLDAARGSARRRSSDGVAKKASRAAGERGTAAFTGPHVASPARQDEDGALYLFRLERVPGGVRLGEWRGSSLAKKAPVLPAQDLADLVVRCDEALQPRDAARLTAALATEADPEATGEAGISRGRSGDFKEELRIERLEDSQVRVARWVLRPVIGWELQDAPPMLPAARYAEALADAARCGIVAIGARAQPS